MERIGWSAFVAITLSGCSHAPLTIGEVIERNTKAMGGGPAIEAVKSIEIDLHIVDPGFEVDGIYRAARPGECASMFRRAANMFSRKRSTDRADDNAVTKANKKLRRRKRPPRFVMGSNFRVNFLGYMS